MLVVVALSMTSLLLLAALVLDVGNWYSHKRQLQNRADAGALAAGVEYAKAVQACLSGDATAAANIVTKSRQFAGDPTATGPVNTEVANQSKVSVYINSRSVDGPDYNDGPPGVTASPCYNHPADPSDSITPQGGYWTDVRVKERDLPSFFGKLGIPLSRNSARARLELKPITSQKDFLPLAIPTTDLVKAQVRYYRYCGGSAPTFIDKVSLSPLNSEFQTVSGTVLWGPDPSPQYTAQGTPIAVDPAGMSLTIPAVSECPGAESILVGVEVRVGARQDVDIDTPTCSSLASAKFADCWTRLSTIRVWKPAPASQNVPWFKSVTLTKVSCDPDPYFARTTPSCQYVVNVDVDWRDWDEAGPLPQYHGLDDASPFRLRANGVDLLPPGASQPSGVWTGVLTNATLDGSPLTLNWRWRNRVPVSELDVWRTLPCTPNNNNPCELGGQSGVDVTVSRVFLADDSNAGVVDLVRTSGAIQGTGQPPGMVLDNIQAPATATDILVYPTIGIRSLLVPGQFRVLRAASGQDNLSVNCEPGMSTFRQFLYRCQKYYGPNSFTPNTTWWIPDGSGGFECPSQGQIFAQPNAAGAPWRCVPKGQGLNPNQIAASIAAAIGNCATITGNPPNESGCSNYACTNKNMYPNWEPDDPRIVNLMILPYGAMRDTNPSDGLPILRFGAYYVTGWQGQGSSDQNPCDAGDGENTSAQAGEIVGYFLKYVDIDGGPVDPTAICSPTDLVPCRPELTR